MSLNSDSLPAVFWLVCVRWFEGARRRRRSGGIDKKFFFQSRLSELTGRTVLKHFETYGSHFWFTLTNMTLTECHPLTCAKILVSDAAEREFLPPFSFLMCDVSLYGYFLIVAQRLRSTQTENLAATCHSLNVALLDFGYVYNPSK